jgi:orotidine-5'-phosphate decarboxylase
MKLCVALDLSSAKENLDLATKIKDYDLWLKVGLRSYIRDGKEFLETLKSINPNFKIFLDLKLHDIPNTMADASYEVALCPIDMFNIHASAGKIAMTTVMQRIKDIPNRYRGSNLKRSMWYLLFDLSDIPDNFFPVRAASDTLCDFAMCI